MEINNKADLKKACLARIGEIDEQIPSGYLSLIHAKHPEIKSSKIINVRNRITFDLTIVKMFEEIVQELKEESKTL